MVKLAVYTVLVGSNYDNLCQPKVIDETIDYICFVRKGSRANGYDGIWRIEEIESEIDDNVRLSRLPKIKPHKTCLKDYDYSLYIDANIIIKDVFIYDRIRELVRNGIKIALINHPFRDCAYQEAYVCIAGCKGAWYDILRQICYLKRSGYPNHGGLFEANVIFRRHNEEKITSLGERWWFLFMKYSKRDQLSLVSAISEIGVEVEYFLPPEYSSRNHYAFELKEHLVQRSSKKMKLRRCVVNLFRGIGRKLLKNYKKS